MATPLVSGAAALRLEIEPGIPPSELRDAVTQDAFELDYDGLPYDGKMGEGRLDLRGVVDSN